jgi:hypothetical protein
MSERIMEKSVVVLVTLAVIGYVCALVFEDVASAEIVFQDDFDDTPAWNSGEGGAPSGWTGSTDYSGYGLPDGAISSAGWNDTQSFVVNYEERSGASGRIAKTFDAPHTELWFRWYVKFDPVWTWGSLTYYKQARIVWGADEYIPDWAWTDPVLRGGTTIEGVHRVPAVDTYWSSIGAGKWYSIEYHFITNTAGNDDGTVTIYFNGVQVQEFTDMDFTHTAYTGITEWNLADNTDNTGPTSPDEWQVYHDNVVVSDSGPIGLAACPGAAEITWEDVGPCTCGGIPYDGDDGGYCVSATWQVDAPGGEPTPQETCAIVCP